MLTIINQNYQRIFLFIIVYYSLINFGMQNEDAIAAKIRSVIAQQVTLGLRYQANYEAVLNSHLKKLEECPLYKRAHFYMITYLGQEWSLYVPPNKNYNNG